MAARMGSIHLAQDINQANGYGTSVCGVFMRLASLTESVPAVTCRKCRGSKLYRAAIGAS